MKISGVNISGGIGLDPPVAPTPSGPSKFVVGAFRSNDVAGKTYIFDSDGTGEVIIQATDGASSDEFSYSVAISDTKVVVGARDDDSDRGSAYIYNTDGTGEQKIIASDGAASDRFGTSVAISDTKIVVGAYRATTSGIPKGAAYVYNTDGTNELKITPSDGASYDYFGQSVAISDTKIVVGASEDDSGRGSVYVYNIDGTGEVKITASDGASGDQFGGSVAISDTKIVVGATGDDDAGSRSGSVYVFNLDGTGEVKITASDHASNDYFGQSVAMSDTKIVVGAPYNDDPNNSGSVYVYNIDGTGEQKITASDGAAYDNFGTSVAITDTKIFVGARGGDGAAYVYNTDGTGELKITASDGNVDDYFGYSIAAK